VDEHLLMHDATTGQDYYYLLQELYTVAGVVDENGDLVEAYAYDAYGDVRTFDMTGGGPVQISVSAIGNPYHFTGRRLDAIPNPWAIPVQYRRLYHYRAREYDPRHGRFLQRDPAEYVDGMNLYEYARSAPLVYGDPYGGSVEWQRIATPADVFVQGDLWLQRGRRAATLAWNVREYLPIIGPKLRGLDSTERALVEPAIYQALTQFAQLGALGIGFSPGGRAEVSERNRFVYTCKSGWIDMGHYYISAFSAYTLGESRAMLAGYLLEIFQEAWRLSGRSDGWANSAFTIEDLPSDALGVKLGGLIRSRTPALNGQLVALEELPDRIEDVTGWQRGLLLAEQAAPATVVGSAEAFDIHGYMQTFFANHGAITNLSARYAAAGGKTVKEILVEDIKHVNKAYLEGPGMRNFSTRPYFIRCHNVICTPDGKPRK